MHHKPMLAAYYSYTARTSKTVRYVVYTDRPCRRRSCPAWRRWRHLCRHVVHGLSVT